MPTIKYKAPDGTTHSIPLVEGQDANAAVAKFEAFNSIKRGIGGFVRAVPFAPARAAAGLSDIAGSVLNLPIKAASATKEFFGGDPIEARVPTNSSQFLEGRLNEFLPEPTGLAERALDLAGQAVATGGVGAAGLAPKAAFTARGLPAGANVVPKVAAQAIPGAGPVLKTQGVGRSLADDIGEFFASAPIKATAAEGAAGAGSSISGDTARALDASPGAQLAADVIGGLAGGFTVQGGTVAARAAGNKIKQSLNPILPEGGNRQAARILQDASADPEAAAAAALAAPDNVRPARATGDKKVQALDERVLADDPALASKVDDDLVAAQGKELQTVLDEAGPGTNKVEFQQKAIASAAPEGTVIKSTQTDDMLKEVDDSFNVAYEEAKGFPIEKLSKLQTAGGDVSLQESFARATGNTRIIADGKVRKGVRAMLNGLLADLSKKPNLMSEDLLAVRTVIREEVRARFKSDRSRAKAETKMLRSANNAVTEVLESQLPKEASVILRATDEKFADFMTVQLAVARSKGKGLTPDALRGAIGTRSTTGAVARSETGALGEIAERGVDVAKLAGKGRDDEIVRALRTASVEQKRAARSDIIQKMVKAATRQTDDGSALNGKTFAKQLEDNTSSLKAAGGDDAQIKRLNITAKRLQVMQAKQPGAAANLTEDGLGFLLSVTAKLIGSAQASNLVRRTGAGAPGSFAIASVFNRKIQNIFKKLKVDRAQEVLIEAMNDKEKFAALMVRDTASAARKRKAVKIMNSFLLDTDEDK
jgi:hypothetical protein